MTGGGREVDGETAAALLGSILPEGVVSQEVFGDPPGVEADLHPREAALLGRAVGKRRREFAGARGCAHRALTGLGVPYAALLPGPGGAPRWPAGVVGSLTHSGDYRAAAVARRERFLALGIDAEPNTALPVGLLETIALPPELDWAAAGPAGPGLARPDRLLFSIKEAVYKTWFPLTGHRLGFRSATVTLEGTAGRGGAFEVRIPGGPNPGLLAGRWVLGRGLLVTAIAVPRA